MKKPLYGGFFFAFRQSDGERDQVVRDEISAVARGASTSWTISATTALGLSRYDSTT